MFITVDRPHTYASRSVKLLHESWLTACGWSKVARVMDLCLADVQLFIHTRLLDNKTQSQMKMHGMAEINSVTQLRLTDRTVLL